MQYLFISCLFFLQEFPAIPKSKSKPEISSHSKTSRPATSLFDDEEEEVKFPQNVLYWHKTYSDQVSFKQILKTVSSFCRISLHPQ